MLQSTFQQLKHFDAFVKPLEDFRVKTFTGAIITFFCSFSIFVLFIYEWRSYMTVDVNQELFVDMSRNPKLTINLNMTFPHLPCSILTLDLMDISGESRNDVAKGLRKIRLDKDARIIVENSSNSKTTDPLSTTLAAKIINNPSDTANNNSIKCLSCYGAEASNIKCCQTCDDVRLAYRQKNWHFSPFNVEQCKNELQDTGNNLQASEHTKDTSFIEKELATGEGCQLAGHFEINKVAGNFHIAPGVSFQQNHMHFHNIKNMPIEKFNTKHYFNVFSFGDEYPNQKNPLELKSLNLFKSSDVKRPNQQEHHVELLKDGFIDLNAIFSMLQFGDQMGDNNQIMESNSISFSYFLKIVPTTYEYLDGRIINNTYQYSVTKSMHQVSSNSLGKRLPGVFVNYEMSPIMVKYVEKSKPFSHFLTGCCAIIGGLFTIASMLDSFAYRYYNMYKKYQMNKLG